jgi:DNA polymerase III epsilon subunit-like protein
VANSMIHWNGHQLVAIDVETTGLIPWFHEIIQLSIVPLDSNAVPRKDVMHLDLWIQPEHPERIDPKAMSVNKKTMAEIKTRGHDREKAKDLLREWVDRLGLPYTDWGNRKRLLPLGHGYSIDKAFVQRWFGHPEYSEIFDGRDRDTMVVANYLNDRAAMHAETVPYSKVTLGWLCKQLGVRLDRAHNAVDDCVATAACYKKLMEMGVIG